jgi:hypothetical protein
VLTSNQIICNVFRLARSLLIMKYGKNCQEEGEKPCEYCGVKFHLNTLSCLDLFIVFITCSAGFVTGAFYK